MSAFANRSSGFGKPRSAKTLPLPNSNVTSSDSGRFALGFDPRRIVLLRFLQSSLDSLDVFSWRLNSDLALLLEYVQHIDQTSELHRVNRPIRSGFIVFDDFKHA